MKLRDLNFKMTGNGDTNEITFDCPKCGPPYRIYIHAIPNGPTRAGVWAWTLANPADMDSLSVTPSIDNPNHGRKKSCGWHGHVSNGEVIDA